MGFDLLLSYPTLLGMSLLHRAESGNRVDIIRSISTVGDIRRERRDYLRVAIASTKLG